jgi:hypothetical protein
MPLLLERFYNCKNLLLALLKFPSGLKENRIGEGGEGERACKIVKS